MENKEFIGIDVSKKKIDVFCYSSKRHKVFNNTQAGFIQMLEWLKLTSNQLVFCLEHCGMYSYELTVFLSSKSLIYHLISGLHVKRTLGIKRGKNDKIDAQCLAKFAFIYRDELMPYVLPEADIIKIKNLLSHRSRIVKQLKMHKTFYREAGQTNMLSEEDYIMRSTKENITFLKAQKKACELEIKRVLKHNEELNKTFNNITSIKGVGLILGTYLIACTNNFKNFSSWRKLACYAGTAPFENQSGSSLKGKTKVSHLANKELKALLSQAASTAILHSPEMKIYYEKGLKEGKSKMSTQNIIRNKLISRVFAVAKRGTPYVDMHKFAS